MSYKSRMAIRRLKISAELKAMDKETNRLRMAKKRKERQADRESKARRRRSHQDSLTLKVMSRKSIFSMRENSTDSTK